MLPETNKQQNKQANKQTNNLTYTFTNKPNSGAVNARHEVTDVVMWFRTRRRINTSEPIICNEAETTTWPLFEFMQWRILFSFFTLFKHTHSFTSQVVYSL
jgi:hypothetical protein